MVTVEPQTHAHYLSGWLEFAGLENDGLRQYGLTLRSVRCLEYICSAL